MGDLAEMVAQQRALVDSLSDCTGERCSELQTHTRTLRLLVTELQRRVPEAKPSSTVEFVHHAQQLADIFPTDVPTSNRSVMGPLVTAVKRTAIKSLRPFHVEVLRPQYGFNLELVDVLRYVMTQRSLGMQPELTSWLRSRLEPLAAPTAWKLRSHRSKAAASAVKAIKKGYLTGLGPVLRNVLEGQHRWNKAAIEALATIASWQTPSAAQSRDLIEELTASMDPLSRPDLFGIVKALDAFWREVLRRQTRFNEFVTAALSRELGVKAPGRVDYQEWCAHREQHAVAEARHAVPQFTYRPLVSIIVSTAEPADEALRACLGSVLQQIYPDWELCIADDGSRDPQVARTLAEYARYDRRIRVLRLEQNRGSAAATNAALEMARGEFVAFLDPDALLAPNALAEVVHRLQDVDQADVLYTDEDRVDESGRRLVPFFKPDWSPDLLRSTNYMRHLLVARRQLVERVGRLRPGFDGAQDYDLVLRLVEQARQVVHIPMILYHGRTGGPSSAQAASNKSAAANAAVRALCEHLARCNEAGEVESLQPSTYRVRYPVRGSPLVSIIVPFKDKPELLQQLVSSLLKHTRYSKFELLLISNNSTLAETRQLLESFTDPRIRKLEWNHPFNYSAINNFGASQAQGELLLFLNNDIEVVQDDWLEELISQAQRPEVGAVGPKLLFPNGTLQHAGVVLGLGGFAGHAFAGLPDDSKWTPFGHADWARNYLAVTSACVMMRRETFDALKGYDETFLVCGSDVEICLRMVTRGMRVVYTPYTKLIHHESATRKADSIPENDFWRSFSAYRPWLRRGDPFYNPSLSLEAADGSLRTESRSPEEIAVRVLSAELPGSRGAMTSLARAEHLRHVAAHSLLMDYTSAQVRRARMQLPTQAAALRRSGKLQTITWLVPYFKHPYGGVHTILRFGHLLSVRHNVTNRFVVYDNVKASARELEAKVATIFPVLPGEFHVLRSKDEMAELPPCDLAVATLWTSAYLLLNYAKASAKAYFVQDFEPLFYPAGSFYALTEQTYRLGLYGIFNTRGLHEYVTANYPMTGTYFEPSVEHSVFHDQRPARTGPVRVFFYGRPSTDRNGFELGISSLKRLKEVLGAKVEIVTAGETWRPADFGLDGVLTNLGVLPYEKTADLYRSCDVGLCFMFTKHPSYLPLEMMACGVTVVTNNNPANLWLLDHERNCLLAEPTVSCVVEQLERACRESELRKQIGVAAAQRMRTTTWEEQVDRVYAALTGREAAGDHTAEAAPLELARISAP